jgi:hypothetical protein
METQIAKIVRVFRKELASRNSRFFLIYSDVVVETNQVMVKVTTNTPVEEVPSMLGSVIEPTMDAANLIGMALIEARNSQLGYDPGSAAIEVLRQVCKLLTIKNIALPANTTAIQS